MGTKIERRTEAPVRRSWSAPGVVVLVIGSRGEQRFAYATDASTPMYIDASTGKQVTFHVAAWRPARVHYFDDGHPVMR